MALVLTGSRDQALVAAVVQASEETIIDRRGAFVGRTALQKMLYFLDFVGVPTRYRFDLHYYGPFCADILRDAEWLVADEVIKEQSGQPDRYSSYAVGPALEEILEQHRAFLDEHQREIQAVAHALAPLRPDELELLATLHFIFRQETSKGNRGPYRDTIVKRFEQEKPGKFQQSEVVQAYDSLVDLGLAKP